MWRKTDSDRMSELRHRNLKWSEGMKVVVMGVAV